MKRKLSKVLFVIILFLSNLFLSAYYYFKKYLFTVDFSSIIYHLMNNANGKGSLNVVLDGIKSVYLVFIILTIIEIMIFTNFKSSIYIKYKKNNKKYKVYPLFISKHKIIFSSLILILSVFILFEKFDFRGYINMINTKTDIYEKYYVDTNSVDINFNDKKRNLILIYLESMESSLFSKENNGAFDESRTPELEKLALDNINFSDKTGLGGMKQLNTTSYTIASLIGSTTSTPLLNSSFSDYDKDRKVFSNVRTLGDVLRDNGYNLEFMQGSDIEFSSTDKYLKNHGDYEIFDYKTAKEREYIDENYFVWWGFEDKKLFEYAKKELTSLSNKDKPFALTLFTIDTHFKDGYLDDSCETKFNDQMSNTYACASKMVNSFIEWIKNQDFYDDTLVVVLGDHLTMQSSYYEDLPNYERAVYNVFINSKKENVNKENRLFSAFDIYPTILSGLGADISSNRIGFGTNLFSNEKTLIEEYGYDYLNVELNKNSDYYYKNIF